MNWCHYFILSWSLDKQDRQLTSGPWCASPEAGLCCPCGHNGHVAKERGGNSVKSFGRWHILSSWAPEQLFIVSLFIKRFEVEDMSNFLYCIVRNNKNYHIQTFPKGHSHAPLDSLFIKLHTMIWHSQLNWLLEIVGE